MLRRLHIQCRQHQWLYSILSCYATRVRCRNGVTIRQEVGPVHISDQFSSTGKNSRRGKARDWTLRLLCLFSIGEYLRPIRTDRRQQTPTNKLAVGFRILWKITAMFTLHQQTPTNSISISMFSRVKTNSNQPQPTPTEVTHCLVQRNVCNTLACANERSAHIQNRYLYHA